MNSGLCDFGELSIKSEGDVNGDTFSDELDHVPLLRRRSMLMANKRYLHLVASNSALIAVENGSKNPLLLLFVPNFIFVFVFLFRFLRF